MEVILSGVAPSFLPSCLPSSTTLACSRRNLSAFGGGWVRGSDSSLCLQTHLRSRLDFVGGHKLLLQFNICSELGISEPLYYTHTHSCETH